MKGLFIVIAISLSIASNIYAQNCIEHFVDNMLAAYSGNNAKLTIELRKNWPRVYTKTINNNGIYICSTKSAPAFSDTLSFINIGLVLGSKLGMKIDKGKRLLPKQDYLCYYDYNNVVFDESVVFCGDSLIGCINRFQSKNKCTYEFADRETILKDPIYRMLLDIRPDVAFRLSGHGTFILYYIKNRRLMAICSTQLSDNHLEPYEILTYEECYEKYLKQPVFYFGSKSGYYSKKFH
ncbi:MAG: hypothetical protein K6F33_10335 [Bacteroidales bacterium]|nr:hypothetical protein [Bacteroidales bacterium]